MERILMLTGFSREGYLEQFFTVNETETAIGVAERWAKRGWKPRLISKTYNGGFRTLFDYKSRNRKLAA